ncbi:MAG: SDR family oxidoreductase, partial [Thermoleophilia bacterium]|nr:SDR family oxidoreductase [Thermoleophilia bacterium]
TGTLGQAFARCCELRGLAYRLVTRAELDIADAESVERALDDVRPWAVVNTAGYVRVDDAESDPERCERENVVGPATLAAACAGRGVRLVTFSSDLVFDGAKRVPYVEGDPVAPLSVYGRTKAEAERVVLAWSPDALVVRTSAFFGPWDTYNFVTLALAALERGEPFAAAADATVSPTYVPDLVDATLDLLIDGEAGRWHLANRGAATWADLAGAAAELAGVSAATLEPVATAELRFAAPRPAFSVLGSERTAAMPTLESALERYLAERRAA